MINKCRVSNSNTDIGKKDRTTTDGDYITGNASCIETGRNESGLQECNNECDMKMQRNTEARLNINS
jgi:hypothetical protein